MGVRTASNMTRVFLCSLVLLGLLLLLCQQAAAQECWAYGLEPFRPREIMITEMRTCCWYHRSTCCYWLTGSVLKNALKEFYELANRAEISERCYTHVADMFCNGCHPDTNSFVTAREFGTRNGSKSEIVVSICPSTCHLFYEACSDFAASRNIFDETEFCENWTHKDVFQFDDDDDNDDDVVYRVSRTETDCFFGHGIASGGRIVERQVGFCLPELRPSDVEMEMELGPPPASVIGSKAPSPRPDWPFPLPPDPAPTGDRFADLRSGVDSSLGTAAILISITLVLASIARLLAL